MVFRVVAMEMIFKCMVKNKQTLKKNEVNIPCINQRDYDTTCQNDEHECQACFHPSHCEGSIVGSADELVVDVHRQAVYM